jgi:hypothetical protein
VRLVELQASCPMGGMDLAFSCQFSSIKKKHHPALNFFCELVESFDQRLLRNVDRHDFEHNCGA